MRKKSGRKVLVIDDVAGVRDSLRAALEAASYEVVTASNGERGLDVLASQEFDIVITDIWMPKVDGLNVIKRLRVDHPGMRVFAMTGGGPRLTIETASTLAEAWGAEQVFLKPFDEAKLLAAIGAY